MRAAYTARSNIEPRKAPAMTGITRRIAIPLGLAALVPAASRAGGRCKRQRNNVQDRFGSGGVCTPDRNVLYGETANFLEAENAIQVTLTPVAGNPQSFTPEAFATALAAYMVNNGAPICDGP
jgi:hypothetical protein